VTDSFVLKARSRAVMALSFCLALACTPIERPRPAVEEPTARKDSGIRRRVDGGDGTWVEVDGGAMSAPPDEPGKATEPSEEDQAPPAPSTSEPSEAGTDKPNVGATPVALLELGGACDSVTQCASGKCQDGVCCESQECGTCYRCDRTGHCVSVLKARDPNTCEGAQYCDASGTCVNIRGTACSNTSECGPDQCVDGICCQARCGVCSTCGYTKERNENNKGTCLLVDGDDPDSCTGTQSCVRGTCTSIDAQSLPANPTR
jgi:hypothetical protein